MSVLNWIRAAPYMLSSRVALQKPIPGRFRLTDPKNDYFTIRLFDPVTEKRAISCGPLPQGLHALWFNGNNEEGYYCIIPRKHLQSFQFQGEHYYGSYSFRTESPVRFIVNWLTHYAWFFRKWDRWTQGRFNKKKLTRHDRMQLLNFFVQQTIKDSRFKASLLGLMEMLYSRRWFYHPEQESTDAYYQLLLDSLTETKDLEKTGQYSQYKLGNTGLTTLATYEQEERRHHDNVIQQERIGKLTIVLVFVGVAQVLASLLAH